MARKSTFVKGSTTYICTCCGHNTRWTGEQGVDSKTCPICWDLAGYENMEQDGYMTEADGNHVTSLFLELKAKRTPEQYAKALKSCDLLEAYFPGEDEDFGVEAMPAELEAEIDANKSARNGAVAACRSMFHSNPGISRKDFVKAAVLIGINKATAGTQYNRIKKEAKA